MADAASLLEPLIPSLRRYAYALVRDPEAADDLVQDTLERALSRWHLRHAEGDLRAWLFAILRNLHVSAWRQKQRRGVQVALDERDEPAAAAAQDSSLEAQDVLAALDRLPEEQKSLLLLIGVEDFSYDEAARLLGVPIGTVMSRLARGRERLRQAMAGETAPPLRRIK